MDDEQTAKIFFSREPEMLAVLACESQFRQFDEKGRVLRGVIDHDDTGIAQINRRYHLENAKKMNLDIDTLMGNLQYAQYLYEKNGLSDWKASASCQARYSG